MTSDEVRVEKKKEMFSCLRKMGSKKFHGEVGARRIEGVWGHIIYRAY